MDRVKDNQLTGFVQFQNALSWASLNFFLPPLRLKNVDYQCLSLSIALLLLLSIV